MPPRLRTLRGSASLLSAAAFALMVGACQPHASEGPSQVVEGLKLEYGIVPSRTGQQHPAGHAETLMHGGPLQNSYHITLAVFDAKTRARIDDADVTVQLSGPGHPGYVSVPLERMTIAGNTTYGGYLSLPKPARYQLTFEVARRDSNYIPVKARFVYDRPG
jgi:hypothetical protein